MTEAQLQDAVISMARQFGWLVYHTHDSRYSESGFPDLFCVRSGRAFAAELKRDGKTPTEAQFRWLLEMKSASIPTYIWRPADWQAGRIDRVLTAPKGSALPSALEVAGV